MTLLTRYRGTFFVVFALAAGAALLAPSVQAQDPKSAPAPPKPADNSQPAPAAPPAGKIDPDAKKAIDQMVAAHQAIKTYSGKLVFFQKQGGRAAETTTVFSFARPNKVKITTAGGPAGTVTRSVISDGKQVYATSSEDTASYVKVDALPNEGNIARAMQQTGGGGTGLFLLLLTDPKAGDKVLGPNVTSLEFQPDSKVADIDVKVIKAVLNFSNGPMAATFSIGKGDNVLRAVSLAPVATTGEPAFLVTETYSDIKMNPTLADSTFTFTPAPGAKEQKPAPASAPGNPAPAKP
jgi:outer membrane lipoprotein-sorting protein